MKIERVQPQELLQTFEALEAVMIDALNTQDLVHLIQTENSNRHTPSNRKERLEAWQHQLNERQKALNSDYLQLSSLIAAQVHRIGSPTGCGLVEMTIDPRILPFRETESILNGDDGIILYNNEIFFADHITRHIKPVEFTEIECSNLKFTSTYRRAEDNELKLITAVVGRSYDGNGFAEQEAWSQAHQRLFEMKQKITSQLKILISAAKKDKSLPRRLMTYRYHDLEKNLNKMINMIEKYHQFEPEDRHAKLSKTLTSLDTQIAHIQGYSIIMAERLSKKILQTMQESPGAATYLYAKEEHKFYFMDKRRTNPSTLIEIPIPKALKSHGITLWLGNLSQEPRMLSATDLLTLNHLIHHTPSVPPASKDHSRLNQLKKRRDGIRRELTTLTYTRNVALEALDGRSSPAEHDSTSDRFSEITQPYNIGERVSREIENLQREARVIRREIRQTLNQISIGNEKMTRFWQNDPVSNVEILNRIMPELNMQEEIETAILFKARALQNLTAEETKGRSTPAVPAEPLQTIRDYKKQIAKMRHEESESQEAFTDLPKSPQ